MFDDFFFIFTHALTIYIMTDDVKNQNGQI